MALDKARMVTFDEGDLEPADFVPHLNLPDLTETAAYKPIDNSPYLLVCCTPTVTKGHACPKCGSKHTLLHTKNDGYRSVHDVSVGRVQVDLRVVVPRYRCQDCGATFSHRFDSIAMNRQMTNRLLEQIKCDAFVHTFSEIAYTFGISDVTAGIIFDEYAKELEASRPVIECPEYLSIDEKHIVKNMRAVYIDNKTGELLEMTADNKKDTVIKTLEGFAHADENLKVVTMDMSPTYRSAIYEAFPNAKIVVDRYHVIQELYRCVARAKTKIITHIGDKVAVLKKPTEKREKKAILDALIHNTYLFKFGQEKLLEKDTRIQLMAEICATFPEFNHLRKLKEDFELIYDCADRVAAFEVFRDWAELVPPSGVNQIAAWEAKYGLPAELYEDFRPFKNTVGNNWNTEIFNYFDEDCRVTNAVAEGTNALIQRMNQAGNGYSFERLRAKALFWHRAGRQTRYRFDKKDIPVRKEASAFPTNNGGFGYGSSGNRPIGFAGPIGRSKTEVIDYNTIYEVVPEDVDYIDRVPISVFLYHGE